MDRIPGRLHIEREDDGEEQAVIIKYASGVRADDGDETELKFTITTGRRRLRNGRMDEFSVIWHEPCAFSVEEFSAEKARAIGQAYMNAAKICDSLQSTFPDVDPKLERQAGH